MIVDFLNKVASKQIPIQFYTYWLKICGFFFMKACGEIIVYYFQTYRKMTNIDETMRESDFHKRSKGLNEMKVADRLQEFGPNFIKISVPPILYLVFHEVIYAPSTFNLQIYFQNEITLVLEFQF